MKKSTLRKMFKWGCLLNILFICGVIADFIFNDAVYMVPLLVAYAAFVFLMILLLIFGHADLVSIPGHIMGDGESRVVVYERRKNDGL